MGEAVRLRTSGNSPAYRPGLIAALDVGSSKVVCLFALER
jgi:cell division ATPase FtsA